MSQMRDVQVDLPGTVYVLRLVHQVETVEHIQKQEYKYDNGDALGTGSHLFMEEFHERLISIVHEKRDDRRKAEARKEARVACQMHRKIRVIPVVEAAELFDGEAQKDLA